MEFILYRQAISCMLFLTGSAASVERLICQPMGKVFETDPARWSTHSLRLDQAGPRRSPNDRRGTEAGMHDSIGRVESLKEQAVTLESCSRKENIMYWFDWFFVGSFVVSALVLSVLRGISQVRSGTAKTNKLWVVSLILMLIAIMVIIASGMLDDRLT